MTTTAISTLNLGRGKKSGNLERARSRQGRLVAWGLVAPALLALLVSYAYPLAWMIRMSFNIGQGNGLYTTTFSLDSYIKPLTQAYYWQVIGNTLFLGVLVALLCVAVSYPIALFLAKSTSRWRSLLVALAIAPLLTSAVVRTFGWLVILGTQGLVNSTLTSLGLTSAPLPLANSFTGVVIGLVEIFMPYAILGMMSGFGRLSPELEEAASSLGASRRSVFLRITLPLSLPGLLTAFLLVFVLSISTFVTPQLLGGGRVHVMATEIYDQTTGLLNWPFAASLSVILLILFGTVVALYQRLARRLGA
jgi:ABC-type spermidine/putrescine transport system, permease component I